MPNMKFTKRELVELNNNLHAVGNLIGPRFVYVVARNISYIKDEIASLQKSVKADDAFIAYDKERVAIATKYSAKDEKTGQPQKYLENGAERFAIIDQAGFDKEIDALKEKYKEALENRRKQEETLESMLDEEIELILLELHKEDLPENITAQQLSGIISLLVDTDSPSEVKK